MQLFLSEFRRISEPKHSVLVVEQYAERYEFRSVGGKSFVVGIQSDGKQVRFGCLDYALFGFAGDDDYVEAVSIFSRKRVHHGQSAATRLAAREEEFDQCGSAVGQRPLGDPLLDLQVGSFDANDQFLGQECVARKLQHA